MSQEDWRISDKQKAMIYDRTAKMSKKEASLLIRIIQAIFDTRISEIQKHLDKNNQDEK